MYIRKKETKIRQLCGIIEGMKVKRPNMKVYGNLRGGQFSETRISIFLFYIFVIGQIAEKIIKTQYKS